MFKRKILINLLYIFIDSVCLFVTNKKTTKTDKKIILVKLDSIGDFIIWVNYAINIKLEYQDHKIILCVNSLLREFATKINIFDQVISIDIKKFRRNPLYRIGKLIDINKINAETIAQPTYSRVFLEGDSIIRASKAKKKIGFIGDFSRQILLENKISNFWYTDLLEIKKDTINEIERHKEFEKILLKNVNISKQSILPVLDTIEVEFDNKFKYIVIFPGAAWSGRIWPSENYISLINWIIDNYNFNIVICGSINESLICENIVKNINNYERLLDLTNKTSISQLVEIIRGSTCVIGNETSAIHIAATVGVNSICILGGGHYGRFLPYPESSNSIKNPVPVFVELDCFGCNWNCSRIHDPMEPMPCISMISIVNVKNEFIKMFGIS